MEGANNGRKVQMYLTAKEASATYLGTCCVCEGTNDVENILNLNGRCPIIGRGWGCLLCKLPPHGAVAVVCSACLPQLATNPKALRFICTGHPMRDGRTPIGEMVPGFDHDYAKHVGPPFAIN